MKRIIFLSLFGLFLTACSCGNCNDTPQFTKSDLSIKGEIEIEGCQYFVVRTYYYNIPIHKGNCKNPIHQCK